MEPGAPGVQRKFLERNGERAVVERRSGLPYFVGVGCVFGRAQRLITRRGMISGVAVVSSGDAENGHHWVGQVHWARWPDVYV